MGKEIPNDAMRHTLSYTVGEHEEGLLRAFLLEHKRLSRRSLSKIKHSGELRVNGQFVTVRASVKAGDKVDIIFPMEKESEYLKPEPVPLEIIYEDEYLLLLNKPAHICTHPTFNHSSGTLANGVMYHWQQKGWQRTFHAVNRLDRDTSGIVLLAQNRFAHQQLALQQKQGRLVRRYYAFVHGQIEVEESLIEAPIRRAKDSLIKREVATDGQFARTRFRVVQRFPDYTWLEIQLETGRTHQVRVHFSHIGHPLLGDDLYGGTREWIDRQALHACYTCFQHPYTGETMFFNSDLPPDMQKLTARV